jgi:integrase
MKHDPVPSACVSPTLQDVLDRLACDGSRLRDFRSAVTGYAKLVGRPPASIALDLGEIRETLDRMVPAAAAMSAKRWANLRSDLGGAIAASGLQPMLRTADVEPSAAWRELLEPIKDQRIRNGLSRFARWATLREVDPAEVDDCMIQRFVDELHAGTLVRQIRDQHRRVAVEWNRLAALEADRRLRVVQVPSGKPAPTRVAWEDLPASFRDEVHRHLSWASVPDPLDEGARARALAPRTLRLRREHIHSAVSAAVATGIAAADLTSLASLVVPETFKALLRQLWNGDGRKLSAYTHGVAGTLIAIASEWVKVPAGTLASLKALRRKLGTLPSGLTPKNQALLRKLDDPRLVQMLVDLPDKLWRRARRDVAGSRRPFIDLQNELAIDLLIHVPLRMENLSSLSFEEHFRWLQGRGKLALLAFRVDETKNEVPLEFEIPAALADRFDTYRNEIAPAVTGKRPDVVFVTWAGTPRGQSTIAVAIQKTVRKHLGIALTPHQFRHIVAKILLDLNPGAFELVRQLLAHKNPKTTTRYYAGIDTRRAGRAHAELILALREDGISKARRRRHKVPSVGKE